MTRNILMAGFVAAAALAAPVYAEDFTIWVRDSGSEFMPKIVDAFNASQSDHKVTLQIVPAAELVQKYGIAAAGGSAPEALSVDLIYTPAFAAAGQLTDITDWAKSLPYFDQLSPAHIAVGTYEDRIYALPFSAEASVLMWNKKLFAEAGLDPEKAPATWAEIRAAAEAVAAIGADTYGFYFSGNCGGCNIFTFAPLIWASGGDIFEDEGRKATMDSPVMRDAIELYRGMALDGLVPAGSQTDSGANFFAAFANGNIGLASSGAFAIGALNNQYPDLDYGVTHIPGKDGGWSSFAGGDNIVISRGVGEAKVEAIKAFIEFAYTLEGQKTLAANGSLPVRGDIAAEALEGLDPRYLIAAEAMSKGRTPYSIVFNDLINSRNGPWITMLNKAFFAKSDDDVQEAIDDAQEEMQSIIDMAY
ncbi:ABC transporter substrate-binding protein [Paracoccus sp. (in: a-proteobacteria)]|uniref:ABC transporter substrate-binding protein n=1 Tax=Paracoccus sp. TaxID=267 RepID=UPI003A874C54